MTVYDLLQKVQWEGYSIAFSPKHEPGLGAPTRIKVVVEHGGHFFSDVIELRPDKDEIGHIAYMMRTIREKSESAPRPGSIVRERELIR